MPKIIPAPFRFLEQVFTFMALASALIVILITNSSGSTDLNSIALLILSVIAGTVPFVIVGGRNRVFFTGVFTISMSLGMSGWSVVDSVFVRHEPVSSEQLTMFLCLFLGFVPIPIAFAAVVTFVIRLLEKCLDRAVRTDSRDSPP